VARPRSTASSNLPEPYLGLLATVAATPLDTPGRYGTLIDGRRFALTWVPGSKAGPEGFRIATPAGPKEAPPRLDEPVFGVPSAYRAEPWPTTESPAPLVVRFENRRDRFGKRLGLNRETQLGDPAFDDRVYLECDAPEAAVASLLASPRSRAALLECLEAGTDSVTLERDGELIVEMRSSSPPTAERFRRLLQSLGAAASALPQLRGRAPRRSAWLALVLGLGALLGTVLAIPLAALLNWLWEPVDNDLFVAGLAAGAAVWALWLPIVFFAVRGRSTSLRDFAISTGPSLVGWPVASVALLLFVNGALDSSPPTPHQRVVAHRYTTKGKSTSYHVVLEPTAGGGRRYELTVPRATYGSLREGGQAVVTTHAGALGYEWLESVRSGE